MPTIIAVMERLAFWIRPILNWPLRLIRLIPWLAMGLLLLLGGCLGLHVGCHYCPLHLARFKPDQIVPVVYGYPTFEMLEKAQQGQIVLGGCVLRPATGACPFCHWPVSFRSHSASTMN